MEILVTNRSEVQVGTDNLKRLAEFVLGDEEADSQSDISIALVDPGEIQELNLRYRRVDRPTDVLSFDLSDDGKLSGEVVIAPRIAIENGPGDAAGGAEEIESLLVHGLLHLLGYTHDKEDDAEVMFDRQQRLCRKFASDGGAA